MTTRRSFLVGLASLIAAPAVVHASSLMPIKSLAFKPTWLGDGLVLCDGAELSRAAYPELFAKLGDRFGGNGVTTFAVPNAGQPTLMTIPDALGNHRTPLVMAAREHIHSDGDEDAPTSHLHVERRPQPWNTDPTKGFVQPGETKLKIGDTVFADTTYYNLPWNANAARYRAGIPAGGWSRQPEQLLQRPDFDWLRAYPALQAHCIANNG